MIDMHYIFYFLICLIGILFYQRQKVKRVYGFYKIFKNTVDPHNQQNCCQIFYDISKTVYTLFFPPSLPDKFNNKHVKIPYEFKENKYVYLLKVPKGVMPIDSIIDEDGNNIFDEIFPYLGPNLDCHGSNVFPKDFGLKKIIIKDINEKEYVFEEDDRVVIPTNTNKNE